MCSSPFLDSAFQQHVTGWGQLGYLIAPQECGRKAGRDVVAVRQVGCSLCTLGGGLARASGVELGAAGKDWISLIKSKMTEARQPECLRHNSNCESYRGGADPLPGSMGTRPRANFLSVLS